MQKNTLTAVLDARRDRRALVLITPLGGGDEELVSEDGLDAGHEHAAILGECFRSGRSKIVETVKGELFFQAFLPAPRIMIIGATHIGQVLVRLAREVGIEPVVVDPRTAFATEERFRDVDIITEWPGEALEKIGLDRRCGVVCLAHVPDIDDEALGAALDSDCFYIGALGSSRSHAKRLERLKEKGCAEAEFGRIHGPVGLDIGSVSPAEIALSIIAEVVRDLRTAPGE
ncbi:MAG: XdhC family protein [Hyphomicrobiaceae bacterium]|nr:XdhC family protein [Hyphomicrobiaceae bacterium]